MVILVAYVLNYILGKCIHSFSQGSAHGWYKFSFSLSASNPFYPTARMDRDRNAAQNLFCALGMAFSFRCVTGIPLCNRDFAENLEFPQ